MQYGGSKSCGRVVGGMHLCYHGVHAVACQLWPLYRNLYVQKMITVVNLNIKMGITVLAFSTAPNMGNKSQPVFYRITQSF